MTRDHQEMTPFQIQHQERVKRFESHLLQAGDAEFLAMLIGVADLMDESELKQWRKEHPGREPTPHTITSVHANTLRHAASVIQRLVTELEIARDAVKGDAAERCQEVALIAAEAMCAGLEEADYLRSRIDTGHHFADHLLAKIKEERAKSKTLRRQLRNLRKRMKEMRR